MGSFGNKNEQIPPAWMSELDEREGLYSDDSAPIAETAADLYSHDRPYGMRQKASSSMNAPDSPAEAPSKSFIPKSPYQASKSSVFGTGLRSEEKSSDRPNSFGNQNSFGDQSSFGSHKSFSGGQGYARSEVPDLGNSAKPQGTSSIFGQGGAFGSSRASGSAFGGGATAPLRTQNGTGPQSIKQFAGRAAEAQEFPELDELIARVEAKGIDEVIGFSDDDDEGEMRLPILIRPHVEEGGEKPDVQDEVDSVTALFMKNGLLDRSVDGYEVRRPQMEMVRNVAKAYFNTQNAVIEAGTGTGKTFAYLLPLVRAGAKTVISTHTKTLQDQLTKRDALKVLQLLNSDEKVVLLKGRSNYLCLKDLIEFCDTRALGDSSSQQDQDLEFVFKEIRHTPQKFTGDISLLPEETGGKIKFRLLEDIVKRFGSKRITCSGKDCEHYEKCFVCRARERAKNAQILVVNHSLLMTNSLLQSKAQDFNILPDDIDTVVFDESHRLEEVARSVFSAEITPLKANAVCELLDEKIKKSKLLDGIKYPDIIDAGNKLYNFLLSKTAKYAAAEKSDKISLTKRKLLELTGTEEFVNQVKGYVSVLRKIAEALNKSASGIEPSQVGENMSILNDKNLLQKSSQSLSELAANFEMYAATDDESTAYIADIDVVSRERGSFLLKCVPIDVSKIFAGKVLAPINESGNAIFTSATLTTNGTFTGYLRTLGIARDTMTSSVGSPFSYSERGALYLPPNGVSANMFGKERAERFLESFVHLLDVIKGGFLVLCTSNATMQSTYELLVKYIKKFGCRRNIYVQSSFSKNAIIKNMLAEKNAITVATQSFWEGVDLPGEALECVVIDRLPFKAAKDPFMELQEEYIKKKGGSAFIEVQLPHMIISMKQGAGRLIRTMSDVGVVAICDDRMQIAGRKSYVSMLLCDLPPFEIIYSEDKIVSFYREAKSRAEESAKHREEMNAASQKKNNLLLTVDDADIEGNASSEEITEQDEELEKSYEFD